MGRKTWWVLRDQMPVNAKMYVFTNREYHTIDETEMVQFVNRRQFNQLYDKKQNYLVMGGKDMFDTFIHTATHIYITNMLAPEVNLDGTLVFPLDKMKYFRLVRCRDSDCCCFLEYKYHNSNNEETQVQEVLQRVLQNGEYRVDRTQIGTYSTFGVQLRFNIKTTIPLLTCKRVSFRSVVNELLWILQGHTDTALLQKRGVSVWNAHTSRAFLDSRGLQHYKAGILGPGYGFQLRHFGARYMPEYAVNGSHVDGQGFDQLQYVEHMLKTDPFSRRILLNYWNPCEMETTALMPCHYSVQFYVTRGKELSCHFTMRSNDLMCGFPWNIASYSILTHLLAWRCGMVPKEIIYSCGDAHIYANHVEQVREQLQRTPRPFPWLLLDPSLKTKDWSEMQDRDFNLAGYFPHSAIHSPMAI